MSTPRMRVAVVGGGIAGLALAVGIVRQIEEEGAAIDLEVFEQSEKFAEIGAGVALGPNAQKCMELLGLGEQMRSLGNGPEEVKDIWFEYRFADADHPECGNLITTLVGDRAGRGSVHRANLLDKMVEQVPKKYCSFKHRVVDYTQNEESITLKFQHGRDADFDLVVACDGIKSPLRKALYSKMGIAETAPKEKYAEWIAWRGMIPAEVYTKAIGRPGTLPIMWLGLDRHILTFPVKNGEMVNIVAFVHDEKHEKINGQTAPWAEDRPSAEMLEDFKSFNPGCRELLRSIEKPSIWGIFDLPPLDVISGDALILTGDAAHATTPHQGSGAGQAIEDGLFLSRLLGSKALQWNPSRGNMARMFEVYRAYRHERAAKVQVTSAQAGLLYEGRGVNGEGLDLEKVRESLMERMRWIWEYDIERNLAQMVQKLEAALQ